MAGIPTVPGSDIDISTPERNVRIAPNALAGPRYRGAEAFAGAVENISDEAGGLERDLQKARNAGIAADADLRMRAAQQSFIESTKGDENEEQWKNRAQEITDKVKDDVYAQNGGIPPSMRNQVNIALNSWGQGMQIQAQTMANLQLVKRTTGKLYADYQEAGRDGSADHMRTVVNLGRSSKLDPILMDEWERGIPKTVAMTAIENGLQTNPKGTTDLLRSGGSLPVADQHGNAIVPSKVFSAKEMDSLVMAGRHQTDAWQKGNLQTLLQQAPDPVTGMIPEATIRAKMKSGEIEEKSGSSLIASQDRILKAKTTEEKKTLAAEDMTRYQILQTRIHDQTGWTADADGYAHDLTQEAAAISNPVHRQTAINDANRQLASFKKKGQMADRPVETKIYQLMQEDRESQGAMIPQQRTETPEQPAVTHWFKPNDPAQAASVKYTHYEGGLASLRKWLDKPDTSKADIEDKFGEGATRESVLAAEQDHYSRVWNEMREWFSSPDGQKATFDEANDHRRELETPFIMQAAKQSLASSGPTTAPKLAPADQEALEWAQQNVDDPRAIKIFDRLKPKAQ